MDKREIPTGCPYCGALPCDWVQDPNKYETSLLFVLADIREALGVGHKPMASELAGIIKEKLKSTA